MLLNILSRILPEKPYKSMDAKTFELKISEDPSAEILDVRTVNEFRTGRIPHAKNINFMGNSFREQINKMDKTKNYYVYCRSGMRSSSACRMMSKLGFKNLVNLSGGILAYKGKIV